MLHYSQMAEKRGNDAKSFFAPYQRKFANQSKKAFLVTVFYVKNILHQFA